MHRRFLTLTATALSLGGCTQMTQHSNMLVFGTNTVIGVTVGASASSVPEISVGYKRQEVALVPLLANTGSEASADGTTMLKPCTSMPATDVPPAGCKFIATDTDGKRMDSYSALASFGATLHANGAAGDAGVSGTVATYFATGIAAQQLASTGGASIISTGAAAKANADAKAVGAATVNYSNRTAVAHNIAVITDPLKYKTYLSNMDKKLPNNTTIFTDACADVESVICSHKILGAEFSSLNKKNWDDLVQVAMP